jgi:aspartate beta-hydroxylase
MNAKDAASKAIGNAQAMLRAGNSQGALALLQEALQASPGHHDLHLNVAMACRAGGDLPGAVQALNAALAAEPYSFLALLSKGSVFEQMGRPRQAAEVYRNALRIAPPAGNTPPSLQGPIANAKKVVDEQAQALAQHLHETLGPLRDTHRDSDLRRFDESVDVLSGVARIQNAAPVQLHYPRLPAIPFFDREYFPWMETLEAATDTIREELMALLDAGLPGFSPYVAYAPGTPENQFAPLNHNSKWSSLWLWKDGERQEDAIAQCPQTAAVLEELPLCDQPGFAPTALFSALAAHTRIPPHTGSTNTRLLVHLPLVLPGPAGFRVGNETREWRIGEAWAFDDTIEHEAWNDADDTRVIMIFDIWNPLLSAAERDLVGALLTAQRDWLES